MEANWPAVRLKDIGVMWVEHMVKGEGWLSPRRYRLQCLECAFDVVAIVWWFRKDLPQQGHPRDRPAEVGARELACRAEPLPRLEFEIRIGVVPSRRPPLGGVEQKGVTLPLQKGDGPVVVQEIVRECGVGCSTAKLAGQFSEVTEIQEGRQRQGGVRVVTVNRSRNGKAQPSQTVFEDVVVEGELLLQDVGVGILIEDQQVNVRQRGGRTLSLHHPDRLRQPLCQCAVMNDASLAGLISDDFAREPDGQEQAGQSQ